MESAEIQINDLLLISITENHFILIKRFNFDLVDVKCGVL